MTYQFNIYDVLACYGYRDYWQGYNYYICPWTSENFWCPTWSYVIAWTGSGWEPYVQPTVPVFKDKIDITTRVGGQMSITLQSMTN